MKIEKFWLFSDNPPRNPDCLVALSYAVRNDKRPSRPTEAVVELAYKWWRRHPRAKVIFSTGDNQGLGVPNSRVMARYAKRLGIPGKNIIEEGRSVNTYENLVYSLEIIKKLHFKRPALVVLDLHARRAVTTARKTGWKRFYWVSTFSKGESGYGCKRLQTYSRFTILCYEIIATVYSKIVGWI